MEYPFSNIEELAADRPLSTAEVHVQNDFYGHASLLKRFAGLHESYILRAALEHGGVFRENYVWDTDLEAALPAVLVRGKYRFADWKHRSSKAVFSVGPMIQYAPPFLDKRAVQQVRKQFGKILLHFPDHSTHHVQANYDTAHVIQLLEQERANVDTVVVCMFWKDVLLGRASAYKEAGFEVACAGHMYDTQFLSRLRSLIELADLTSSNRVGNQVGYSVLLGKPHKLFQVDVELVKESDAPVFFTSIDEYDNAPIVKEITNAFRTNEWGLTPTQRQAVEKYWCPDELLDQRELLTLIHHCSEMYELGPKALLGNRHIELLQLQRYVANKDFDVAMDLLTHCFKIHGSTPGLEFVQALILAKHGEEKLAKKSLVKLLDRTEHTASKRLLQELQ